MLPPGGAAWIVDQLRDAGIEAQVGAAPAGPAQADDTERMVEMTWVG